jgi:anion transporter
VAPPFDSAAGCPHVLVACNRNRIGHFDRGRRDSSSLNSNAVDLAQEAGSNSPREIDLPQGAIVVIASWFGIRRVFFMAHTAHVGTPAAETTSWPRANWGLLAAIMALTAILLLPTPAGLPIAGHRMLAILAFAVIVWMTEAIDYAVSAIVIAALMAFLLGTAPNVANPKVLLGTSGGMSLAFSGFATTGLVLVAAALFLAAAMTQTGLDRRVALTILSRVGTSTRSVVVGTILVGFVIAFMVPSTTARVACLVPITLGIISAFGVNKRSVFASMLMITTVQTASIWNVGIKTAAAQNMIAIGFIEKSFNQTVTWGEWLIAAAPFGILMSVALYFVMTLMMPPEVEEVPGGMAGIRKSLAELGPMKSSEKKLLAISLTLIGFWATEGVVHSFDTSTTTVTAVALMFMPGIGILTWKDAQPRIPWGTVILFGTGISLGTALLQTKAATWLADLVVAEFGLKNATALFILGVMSLFLIIIHFGFASATALASAMIPIVIAVLKSVATPGINIIGMTMLLQFVVSFGFILVVNAPQNMVAYGTETFAARDFVRTGLVITLIAIVLVMLLGLTYWHWLGYV